MPKRFAGDVFNEKQQRQQRKAEAKAAKKATKNQAGSWQEYKQISESVRYQPEGSQFQGVQSPVRTGNRGMTAIMAKITGQPGTPIYPAK